AQAAAAEAAATAREAAAAEAAAAQAAAAQAAAAEAAATAQAGPLVAARGGRAALGPLAASVDRRGHVRHRPLAGHRIDVARHHVEIVQALRAADLVVRLV